MPLYVIVSESGLNPSTVKRIRAGKQRPHGQNAAALLDVAVKHGQAALVDCRLQAPTERCAAMHVYLRTLSDGLHLKGMSRPARQPNSRDLDSRRDSAP